MANTRFKGANSSERLTLSTLSDSDMFQTRHLPGTVNDADKGVSKALLQALPVAVCATAAATAVKVGVLAPESCPDFTLVNGRVIHVYFSAANTASVPTINVAGTGAIPIVYPNGDYVGAWAADTTMDLMYISITVDNTAIERWVVITSLPVDEVTADNMHSVTSNAVAARFEKFDYSENEVNTGRKWIDGKPIYKKVVIIGNTSIGTNNSYNHNISNLGTVISLTRHFMYNNNHYMFWDDNMTWTVTSSKINISGVTSLSVSQLFFIIEYTKSTD